MIKNYYVLVFLSLFSFYGCNDEDECKDRKLGEANLMETTDTFIDQFVGKTVVFVDSSDNEIDFVGQEYIQSYSSWILLKSICGVSGSYTGWEYIECEDKEILLNNSTENLRIHYRTLLDWASEKYFGGDTVFNDFLNLGIHIPNNDYYAIGGNLILSTRGHGSNPYYIEPPEIDTVILNQQFYNIYRINYFNNSGIIIPATFPSVIYISKSQGLIAFRMFNGKMWRFDRIE